MWKWLHPYAHPESTYQLCEKWLPWLAYSSVVVLLIGWGWGLGFAPPDYQQKDSYRIIFVHVPAAILSMGVYSSMAVCALVARVWQIRNAESALIALAPVGAAMTLIALFTGSIWGKPMWGTWWEWDARLTSELILLFLYLGIIALYRSFDDKDQAGKAASILTLVGVVNLPVIHFSVDWWNTLHQGAAITRFNSDAVHPSMLWPLLISLLGMALFVGWVTLIRLQAELVVANSHRNWVKKRLNKDS